MLALPLLVGVAAVGATAWHGVLAVAALVGYLEAATVQAWLRARRRPSFVPSLVLYGAVFAASAVALVVAFPALLLLGVVLVPAGLVVIAGARPGTRRDLANSLGQTAIALALVPAAAIVSGAWDGPLVVAATAVAGGYLVGVVLVVRSVIRERGNRAFAAGSVGFHLLLVAGAALALPAAYAVLALALALRAAAIPALERRLAGTAHPLRPVHSGIVESFASAAVVLTAFLVPLGPALGG